MGFQVNEVQRSLRGADYPMSGKQLAALAERNGARRELVEELAGIGSEVPGPTVVMEKLKGQLGGPTPESGSTGGEHDYKDVQAASFQVNEVQKYLRGADYPMDGGQLAELARHNGAGESLVEALRSLREADGPTAVMRQLRTT